MLRERGLVSGRAGASARDLSTLFLARSAELYLKPGGRFAFILPNGVLTRQPHAAFRSGLWEGKNFRLKAEFDTAWDLAGAATGFPNHAAVVSGSRSETAKPISSTVEKWVTTGTKSAVTWDEMLPRLSRVPSEVGVTGGAVDEYFSPYKSRFRQGAVLAPLVLLFVVDGAANPLGVGAGRQSVQSLRTNLEKDPWKLQPALAGVVEKAFVVPVHRGETTLPYRLLDPLSVVLPVSPVGDKILLPADIAAHADLSAWWECAESVWAAHKSTSDKGSLLDRIDYMGQLSAQLPATTNRVVYTQAGNSLAATRVETPAPSSTRPSTGRP